MIVFNRPQSRGSETSSRACVTIDEKMRMFNWIATRTRSYGETHCAGILLLTYLGRNGCFPARRPWRSTWACRTGRSGGTWPT
jgi:hypothetical protein